MRFLDTNILIYAVGEHESERQKIEIARSILNHDDLALSAQVLQEFYVQVTRPTRPDALSSGFARSFIATLFRFPIRDVSAKIFRRALATHERFQISYWDAAILEAARDLGCETLLSEDLSHGQDYGGVTVVNPFREAVH